MGVVYLVDTIYQEVLPLHYCYIVKSKFDDEVKIKLTDKSFKDYWDFYSAFRNYGEEREYRYSLPIRKDILFYNIKDAKQHLIKFIKNHNIKDIID
jgi:hypothetical protein